MLDDLLEIFYRTESESIESLKKLLNPSEAEEDNDPFEEVAKSTSEKPSEEDDYSEDSGEKKKTTITDDCRGDDKFRCGKTSVFICEVEKCDGVKNCPNGEDEENCPSGEAVHSQVDEGSGDDDHDDNSNSHTEVEAAGDFFYFKIFLIFFFVFRSEFFSVSM